jgi:hypothetical protein
MNMVYPRSAGVKEDRGADIIGPMPTVVERLAVLEQIARDNREKIDTTIDLLSGGGDVTYDRSVRGRLHTIETTLIGLAARRNYGFGFLKGWERFILVACAVATAAKVWFV